MPHIRNFALTAIVAALVGRCNAHQAFEDEIVGCNEIDCHIGNFSHPFCEVTNITFNEIGLIRIPDVPDALDGFSISKGVNVAPPTSNNITSIYYLGTPENTPLEDVQGCAVLFHDPPEEKFSAGNETCAQVISQECIDALQDRAARVVEEESEDACETLKQDLRDNDIEECQDMAGLGRGIGDISVMDLSEIENIDDERNATSRCWPMLPATGNLAELFSEYKHLADGIANFSIVIPEINRITPLLTVFTNHGNESIVEETVSRLTCIAVERGSPSPEEDEDSDDNAAPLLGPSSLLASSAIAAALLML